MNRSGGFWCALTLALCSGIAAEAAVAGENLIEAVTRGKVDFFGRLRYEHVDDEQGGVEDADAFTLRTALGYETGLFYKFGAYLQFEDVRAIVEDYNDGGTNGKTQYATVVDPEGTELKQANMRYEFTPASMLRVGRQDIQHRKAPLHRYIGNVLWRQHWQTFDAARLTAGLMPAAGGEANRLLLDYTYAWNVNRIFGEDNPLPDRSDYPMNSHFFKANWDGFEAVKLEGYLYSLDFDHSVSYRFSTNTVGLRGEGERPVGGQWKVLYTAEFAHQWDAYENPNDIDVNYYLVEGGASYKVGKPWLDAITVKASYEVLEGDGGQASFQTPLGTNHAFQGWADRFLVTPGDGIEDLFFTLRGGVFGANVMVMYHDLAANDRDYDYGTEWDVVAEKPFLKHWMAGVKYADYSASDDALNVAANSGTGQAFDKEIFWAYLQFKW